MAWPIYVKPIMKELLNYFMNNQYWKIIISNPRYQQLTNTHGVITITLPHPITENEWTKFIKDLKDGIVGIDSLMHVDDLGRKDSDLKLYTKESQMEDKETFNQKLTEALSSI